MYTLKIPVSVADRLPDRALEPLQDVVSRYAAWSASLPWESKFYLNKRPAVRPQATSGPTVARFEPDLAPIFFDYHSILTSQVLLRGWRVDQLIEGLAGALANWNITVAATTARALVETACAWSVESKEIADTWNSVAKVSVHDLDALSAARRNLITSLRQVSIGTRLSDLINGGKGVQRTNVLTHIQKAAKASGYLPLIQQYEELSDAVHPSWGSMEIFWAEVGVSKELLQSRVLLSRTAAGQPGDRTMQPLLPGSGLILTILSSATWACERLLADLEEFEVLCRDVCLTCQIFTLQDLDYWTVVRPTDPYQPCACGSGKKTRFCLHTFGRSGS